MYKNDINEALLELSEKELLVAILKSQMAVYRNLNHLVNVAENMQRELLVDEKKRVSLTKKETEDVFIELLSYINDSAIQTRDTFNNGSDENKQTMLEIVGKLRIIDSQ